VLVTCAVMIWVGPIIAQVSEIMIMVMRGIIPVVA
jgi:hypothetical protein